MTNSDGLYCMRDYPSVNGTNVDDYATPYYAFDAGIARIYILNANWSAFNRGSASEYPDDYASNWTQTSEEYQWLENDLQQHQQTPLKFAFWHYPLYSDDHNEPSDTYLQGADSLSGLLARNGVQFAFNGHAHSYQRNFPDPNGLRSYTTGTGGAIALTVGGPTGTGCSAIDAYAIGWDTYGQSGPANTGDRCGAAPTPVTPAQVYHYLKVTIDGMRVTITPTDSLGQTFDVQTYDFGLGPPGYPRPKGATPVRVPLAPAYKQCTATNRTHGPPLAFPSCNPPVPESDYLTVGTPDANGQAARSSGSVTLRTVVGNPSTPADEADVQVVSTISDVRNKTGLADYTGQVQVRLALRITDKLNGPSTSERATGDMTFNITSPCTTTGDPAAGSNCAVTTTIDALTPGAVVEGKRAIWEVGKIAMYDGGSDGVVATAPNTLFADQAIFIP